MTVKGSTALVRLAGNPSCEILGAMVMQEGSEKRFYERIVGKPYDREFGERQSSKRRGTQFERNVFAGDARLLREAFSPFLGIDADEIIVRNLFDDYPGTKDDSRVARLRITRGILADAVAGRPVPHIIVQPQLLLPTRPGPRPYFFIAPDVLVRSPVDGVYLPGDLKSFIVRENEVAKGDLARVRLQLGAQVLALMHEYHCIDPSITVGSNGMLIFSRPNGLNPHTPRVEDLGGAIEAIRIGITAFLRHRQRINELRAGAEPFTVAADLSPNFQDACLTTCVMAPWCRQRAAGQASDMGEVASKVLDNMSIQHVIGLMTGTIEPANDHERIVAIRLRELAAKHNTEQVA
ncbi:hypothetical protein [Pseudomonas aeruginosa]|jgi:hypothetical protein|uniref:hypothetical protein n=4 Tax=Pseudomonas aeruginosa TaxID=287 RepID=UPI0003D20EF8|nr:hypothetical protein [Pseudomonas aeruginosa]AHB53511.1 hypothetical protein U769_01310 [Pseudomonas aeruginosa MTB-1]EKN9357006.1 hypothetical protein [Pseudomonas aeruginosa]EKW6216696.1 hypothetical protein [Pseudomonas aeruginosa]ELK2661961.1 hypothetical protein [Pseudomonas aeruginosa]ELK4897064.1 hypothetical protein [Pseudomonas aeruginosa]